MHIRGSAALFTNASKYGSPVAEVGAGGAGGLVRSSRDPSLNTPTPGWLG